MHSFLRNLLPDMIKLLDDLRKQQAADAGVTGSDNYATYTAYGHVVPEAPPKVLPFVATSYKAIGIANSDWLQKNPLPIIAGKKRKVSVALAGAGGVALAGAGVGRGAGESKPAKQEAFSPPSPWAAPPNLSSRCGSCAPLRLRPWTHA